MGDGYGPMVVTRQPSKVSDLRGKTIAVPGTLTTAFLALRLCLGLEFPYVVVPFDHILDVTEAGEFQGTKVDAGLIIHEGQLTYRDQGLHLAVDLGEWWKRETTLPLPLGANGIRKDLGAKCIREVNDLLKHSIRFGLEHRANALQHAEQFGRGLDRSKADEFVGMYVNDWTLDFGPRGRQAVSLLLERAHAAGIVPHLVRPEFVET
jgi:1,4-dihydroxy-6-naphthoate synthase